MTDMNDLGQVRGTSLGKLADEMQEAKELAKSVKEAVARLNIELHEAAKRGIMVELEIHEITTIDSHCREYQVVPSVSKVL